MLVSYTHICLLVEKSVTDVDASSQTVPCDILDKETFWKVARLVCTYDIIRDAILACALNLPHRADTLDFSRSATRVFQDVQSTFPWSMTIDFEDTKDDSRQQWTLTLDTRSSARRFVAAMRKAFRKLWTVELEVNCPPGSDLLQ